MSKKIKLDQRVTKFAQESKLGLFELALLITIAAEVVNIGFNYSKEAQISFMQASIQSVILGMVSMFFGMGMFKQLYEGFEAVRLSRTNVIPTGRAIKELLEGIWYVVASIVLMYFLFKITLRVTGDYTILEQYGYYSLISSHMTEISIAGYISTLMFLAHIFLIISIGLRSVSDDDISEIIKNAKSSASAPSPIKEQASNQKEGKQEKDKDKDKDKEKKPFTLLKKKDDDVDTKELVNKFSSLYSTFKNTNKYILELDDEEAYKKALEVALTSYSPEALRKLKNASNSRAFSESAVALLLNKFGYLEILDSSMLKRVEAAQRVF